MACSALHITYHQSIQAVRFRIQQPLRGVQRLVPLVLRSQQQRLVAQRGGELRVRGDDLMQPSIRIHPRSVRLHHHCSISLTYLVVHVDCFDRSTQQELGPRPQQQRVHL